MNFDRKDMYSFNNSNNSKRSSNLDITKGPSNKEYAKLILESYYGKHIDEQTADEVTMAEINKMTSEMDAIDEQSVRRRR